MTSDLSLDAFFHPPARAPLAVLEAARALRTRSVGEVRSALLTEGDDGAPHPDGVYSERLFGPVRDHRCACGKLRGRAHDGERCRLCGVECIATSSRAERWAHVASPAGLVHPALAPWIATCLGWTEAQVWAVAFFEAEVDDDGALASLRSGDGFDRSDARRLARSGPQTLRRLLASVEAPPELLALGVAPAELILDAVPVTPPASRPLLTAVGGARMPGMDSVRYQELLIATGRYARARALPLAELRLPLEHLHLQTAFDALCAQLRGRAVSHRSGWAHALTDRFPHRRPRPRVQVSPPPDPELWEDSAAVRERGNVPSGCAFLDAATALVLFPRAALRFRLRDAAILDAWSTFPGRPLSLTRAPGTGPRLALAWDDELSVLDLDARAWRRDAPGAPLTFVAEREGGAYLSSARLDAAVPLPEVIRGPARWTTSPDGRWVWAEDRGGNGGLFDCHTGLRVRAAPGLVEGKVTPGNSAFAFALGADGRFHLFDRGVLQVGEKPPQVLGKDVTGTAAAFDARGERLLIAGPTLLMLLRVTPTPKVIARFQRPLSTER